MYGFSNPFGLRGDHAGAHGQAAQLHDPGGAEVHRHPVGLHRCRRASGSSRMYVFGSLLSSSSCFSEEGAEDHLDPDQH